MRVTLASLDLFWMVNQARSLQSGGFLDHYFTTRLRPEVEGIQGELGTSCYPLHYLLRIMQMSPGLVGGNHFYLQLCRAFDYWVRSQFSRDIDILTILSGVGLQSFRAARGAGVTTVVECGSTHPDFQHEIVLAELHRNGINRPLFPKGYRDRVRTEFEEADYIQIPTRFVGRTFLERGISEIKLLYSPYGVDQEKFKAKDVLRVEHPFRAICSSGINLRKGARVLMEAWRKLAWTDAELHWIGKPPSDTAHLFRHKPRTVIVHEWMGHEELSALYRRCDVFVLPSFEEGFARVMLEAAASGLPLIVTPNTGAEDFLSPGAPEGWLIPVNDVDALCDALVSAKQDRNRTFALGQRAAKRARAFTWDAYGERVLANYQRVLERKANGPIV
jgi:glycosyltransferase involved in cell wall biosynthesis